MTISQKLYIKTEIYPPNFMLLGYYKQCKLYCIIDWTIMMLMVYINNELMSTWNYIL